VWNDVHPMILASPFRVKSTFSEKTLFIPEKIYDLVRSTTTTTPHIVFVVW
jgi:hypothetical protein